MLGPLTGPGSRFLELLVVVDAPGFSSLRLPDAVRRVIYAPGVAAGEIALREHVTFLKHKNSRKQGTSTVASR
jgi:hypothetical protein